MADSQLLGALGDSLALVSALERIAVVGELALEILLIHLKMCNVSKVT